jgi:hypothetical protein
MNNGTCGVVFILFLMLVSGAASSGAGRPEFRTLAKGSASGITEAKQEVIKDTAVWEKLWAKHMGLSTPVEKMPAVDLSKDMIVMVTMGRQRTGGYAIEIVKVEPSDRQLRITVKRISPPSGAITTQALTAPFHFVAIPKSDLKPEFVEFKPASTK